MACQHGHGVLGIALAASLLSALPARAAEPAPVAATASPPAVDPEMPGKPPGVPALAVSSVPITAPQAAPEGLLARQPSGAADKAHRPLYRNWVFWTLTGVLVVGTAALTYAVTRPPPSPYYGNILPPLIALP